MAEILVPLSQKAPAWYPHQNPETRTAWQTNWVKIQTQTQTSGWEMWRDHVYLPDSPLKCAPSQNRWSTFEAENIP